ALFLFDVRRATSGERLQQNLLDAVDSMDLARLPASRVISGVEDPDITVVEWVVQQISDNYDGTVKVSQKDLEKFLEKTTIPAFFAGKMSSYIDGIYNGTGSTAVTTEEVENLLRENAPLVKEVFGTDVREQDIVSFASQVVEMDIWELLEPKALEKQAPAIYYGMQFGLSYWCIGFFALLAVVAMLLLAKTNKRNMLRTCGDIGITLTVLCCPLIGAALFAKLFPSLWSAAQGNIPMLSSFTGSVLYGGLTPTFIVLGVSVVLILINAIGKRIIRNTAKKQA
ncbi:MAG: hypothetical protein PUB93_00395, partial [Firmicutes bacterium]|nr:hypothetical protein [Bacillota bacterium]